MAATETRATTVRPTGMEVGRFGPAVLSGFIGTTAMAFVAMLSYFAASAIGRDPSNTVTHWFRNLTNNPVTDTVRDSLIGAVGLNLLIGLIWAMVFAFDASDRLKAYPGWLRGAIFIVPPYLLSLLLLPLMPGAGFLGLGLQAGPLPIVGNLILHLVFGVTLGAVYALDGSVDGVRNNDPAVQASLGDAESRAGYGVLIGAFAGAVATAVGAVLVAGPTTSTIVGALVGGGVVGAAIGAVFGSVAGLSANDGKLFRPNRREHLPATPDVLPVRQPAEPTATP